MPIVPHKTTIETEGDDEAVVAYLDEHGGSASLADLYRELADLVDDLAEALERLADQECVVIRDDNVTLTPTGQGILEEQTITTRVKFKA